MRKKMLLFSFILCFFLAAMPFNLQEARAIGNLGDYIAVKADPDDLLGKELWTFRSTAGTSGSFKVNTSSYTPSAGNRYECSLFITNENGLTADDNQVLWVKDESILGTGSNLSSGLNGFANCCQDTAGACGASNCDWTGARATFNAAYGSGWSDKCSGSDCNLSQSDTYYRPKSQILCMGTWNICESNESASCLDNNWLCDRGTWQKCPTGCRNGACATSELTIAANPTSASIAGGGAQGITFTVRSEGTAVNGARVNARVASGGGTLSSPSCNTNASGQCSLIYTAPATSGTAQIEATASNAGIESSPVTVNITITAGACPTGARINFNSGSYIEGGTMTLEGLFTPAGTVFSLCLYNPSGAKANSKEGVMVAGLNPQTVTATATVGTWTGIIKTGLTCSNTLDAGDTCRASVTVTSAPPAGGGGGEGGGGGGGGETEETPQAEQPLPSIARCDTNSWIFCNPLAGTIENLMEAGTKSVQALLALIGTIALLFLVIAGVSYMTAAGDEEKVKNAKRIITGTIIGLGIALISFSLLQAILDMMNGA